MIRKIIVFLLFILIISNSFMMVYGKTEENDNILKVLPVGISGSFSGIVCQTSGDPIYNAIVEVIRQDQDGYWSTTTETDGSYIISEIPSGYYKIRANKEGYAREYYNNVFCSDEAELIYQSGSEDITGIDFSLTLGGGISGIVYDKNDGSPIKDADIWIRPSKYQYDEGFHAYSDSNGYYLVEGLTLGFYKASVGANGYSLLRYYDDVYGWDNANVIEVNPPDITEAIDISLELAGSITGFVYEIDSVTPINDADICADPINGGYEGIGTSSITDGSFIIDRLPPNDYTLRINHEGSWYASEFYDSKLNHETADIVNVNAGEVTSGIIFTLEEGGRITGYVFDEETGDPISDLQLGASLVGGGGTPTAPGTSFDGSYKFVLHEGDYYIEAGTGSDSAHGQKYIHEWYNNSYNIENAIPVRVNVREETSNINFYLSKSGSISGNVYDDLGNPLSDASVSAFSNDFSGGVSISGEDGSYIISGLPSDNYYVQVSILGYISEFYDNTTSKEDATSVIVNAPDNTSNIDFYLTLGDTQPPFKPTINGPINGKVGEEYNFTAVTNDPDDDKIYYIFDWGDDSDTGWFGPFNSGENVSYSHIWSVRGDYEIKVKAKDIYGIQSEWSDPLTVSMPRSRSIDIFNPWLIRLIQRFLILEFLL